MTETPGEDRDRLLTRMREGARDAMRRTGAGARKLAPAALMATLCAGAFAPVVATAIGTGAVTAAAIGVAGGVGGNLLTEAVGKVIARLGGRGSGAAPTIDEIETALAEQFAEALDAGTEHAEEQRRLIVDLMRHLEFSEDETRALIAEGDEATRREITAGFARQDAHLTAFGTALDAAVDAAGRLATTVEDDFAGREAERDRHGALVTRVEDLFDRLQGVLDTAGVPRQRGPRWTGPPYVGLTPFRDDQAAIFHGRESLVDKLLNRDELTAGGVLVVTGASGAGKSSVLRAGLVPAFRRGDFHVPGSHRWPRVVMTPGADPMKALAVKLAGLTGGDAITLHHSLRRHPEEAGTAIRQAVDVSAPGARMLLVVDQFEELFTLADEGERRAFITAVDAVGHDPDRPAVIVLSVRGDFFDRCAAHPELTEVLEDHTVVVGPMTDDELRQAITAPATAANLEFEDEELVRDILADLHNPSAPSQYRVAALPLLSQTMRALWDERSGNVLTRRAYAAMGGVSNAVTSWAERVHGALDTEAADAAKALFRQLVDVSADRVARRPARLSELDAADEATTRAIDAFVEARLLVAERETVAIAHDCLLEFWPRLKRWVGEKRASLAVYQRLNDEAANWLAKDRNPSFLYRGTRLREVEAENTAEWSDRRDRYVTPGPEVVEFLLESRRVDDRRKWTKMGGISALVMLLVMALTAAGLVLVANETITEQRNKALSEQIAAKSLAVKGDGTLARLLAAAAWNVGETQAAWNAMTNAADDPAIHLLTKGHRAEVTALAFSQDGVHMATGGQDGSLAIWNVRDWSPVRISAEMGNPIDDLAFSPDGGEIAVLAKGVILVWDVAAAEVAKRFQPFDGSSSSGGVIEYSADGRRLGAMFDVKDIAKKGYSRMAVVFDADTTARIALLRRSESGSFLGFTPALDAVFVAEDGVVTLTKISDEKAMGAKAEDGYGFLRLQPGNPFGAAVVCGTWTCELRESWDGDVLVALAPSPTTSLAFSGGGHKHAVGVKGGVDLWDVRSRSPIGSVTSGMDGSVLEFTPDGSALVAATADGVAVWDVSRIRKVKAAVMRDDAVSALSYTADGATIVMSGYEGSIEVHDREAAFVRSVGTPSRSRSVISADGAHVAVFPGGDHPTVRMLDVATGAEHEFELWADEAANAMETAALSPDGTVLCAEFWHRGSAEGGGHSEVRLWDTTSGRSLTRLSGFESSALSRVAFSPDGTSLATSDLRGLVRVWSVPSGRMTGELEPQASRLQEFGFLPDGHTLAIGTDNGLTVWDMSKNSVTDVPMGEEGWITTMVVSPNGRYLALALLGGDFIVVWDLLVGTAATRFLGSDLTDAAFSPDGNSLALFDDGILRVYDVSFLQDPYAAICARAGRGLTDAEWDHYLGGLSREDVGLCA